MNYSRIIVGTMSWGNWGKQFNTRDIISLINSCLDQQITTFDHADIYGGFTTESDFGKAFKQSNIKRNDIQLISKCGIAYVSPNRSNKIKHYNYSKEYIITSVETSLKNLETDYLDALLLHRPSPLMNPHEVMEAIAKLGQEGKIKSFGVSNFTPSQVELIASEVPVELNQIEFSLTHYNPMFDGTLDQMMTKKITPMAWSPLGVVFKEDTEQTRRIHKCLGTLLDKYNATEDQLLLAWILKHPANIHPVIGTTTKNRIKDANDALKINIEIEDWFSILVASQGHKVP
ncbi:MAG: aldo/keto reductase [Bacteroidetes bacterium]|nr:MAG: aldo/keto reductase [Bacteroidota bacterium]